MSDKFFRGVALGVAAAATAALFVPAVAEATRPAARRGMKLAILAFLQGREAVASFVETAEDAYAEACAELKKQAESMAEDGGPSSTSSEAMEREIVFEPKRKSR